MYGDKLPRNEYRPEPDVVGEIRPTPAGNVAVRIGRTLPSGGWEQTAYVVLTPEEREGLIAELEATR